MKTYHNLYSDVYSFKNLYLAFLKAKKYKTQDKEAIEFEYHLEKNLFKIQDELKGLTYQPQKPRKIRLNEPAKRIIFCPSFMDRVIQQALLQIINPLFERSFIFDSYAFRQDKGTHKALERFDVFKRKTSPKRFPNSGFILKVDIKDYYPSISHAILLKLIEKRIRDKNIIWLIEKFLKNHSLNGKGISIGGPLSQLFANIYLNELDCYVKHTLKKRFYLRYCDDFVVLERKKKTLREDKCVIETFLKEALLLELNPDKTRIIPTNKGRL